MHRPIRIFAIITSIATYFVIVLGVLVTTTGSGHGCGNTWPFCHGQIIPHVITVAGLIEYSHRIISSLDGAFVLLFSIGSWLLYRTDARVKLFAFLSLFFVILQGALGALTVMFEGTFALNWILAIHFGLSLIAFASVILLTIRLFQVGRERQARREIIRSAVPRLQFPVWAWPPTPMWLCIQVRWLNIPGR